MIKVSLSWERYGPFNEILHYKSFSLPPFNTAYQTGHKKTKITSMKRKSLENRDGTKRRKHFKESVAMNMRLLSQHVREKANQSTVQYVDQVLTDMIFSHYRTGMVLSRYLPFGNLLGSKAASWSRN